MTVRGLGGVVLGLFTAKTTVLAIFQKGICNGLGV